MDGVITRHHLLPFEVTKHHNITIMAGGPDDKGAAPTAMEVEQQPQPEAVSGSDENSSSRKRKRKEQTNANDDDALLESVVSRKRKRKEQTNEKDDETLLESVVADTVAETLKESVANMETSIPSSKKQNWMDFYNRLVAFEKENGHCEVPQRYKSDPSLGAWCKNQREYYKRYNDNKTSSLTEERIALLNKLGFAWVSTKTRRKVIKSFGAHMEDLQKFKEENGHTRVPHVYDANPGLGVFCHRVKIYYREIQEGKRKSPNDWLTPERITALQELGFEWKVGRWTNAPSWEDRYQQLVEHKNQTGHCNISKEYDAQHAPGLKAWVANQRTYLSRTVPGKRMPSAIALTEEKIASLKSLGVDFDRSNRAASAEDDEEPEVKETLEAYDTNTVAL